jgi:multisubunit Na+/H+ antiporter MnhG subunit
MLIQLLDIIRIVLVGVAFYFGYAIGFGETYDPVAQLHFMTPVVTIAIAGISGLEGLLFGKKAALAKGYETGSNYQKQSAFALLSYAFGAVIVYFADWGIKAELTILFVFFFFFTLSAGNHAIEAIRHKNYKWQNINRPLILLMLLAGFVYPVLMVL